MSIVIYYINLNKRTDRYKNIIEELSIIKNINIERIEAIDKDTLDRNELIKNKFITEDSHLRNGQIACIFSHKKAWETFLKSNYDYAIFLEDDVVINKEYFELYFEKIINELNNINFDWLYLGRNNLSYKSFYKGKLHNKYFYNPIDMGIGAHSYILTKRGAEIKIEYYNKLKGKSFFTNHPLDLMESTQSLIDYYLNKKFVILSILPLQNYNSDIIKESFSREFLFYPKNINDSDTS